MARIIIFDFDRTIGTLVIDWTEWRKQIKDLILEFDENSSLELKQIRHVNQNDLIRQYGSDFRNGLNQVNEQVELTLVSDFIVNQKVLDYIKETGNELHCWSSNSRKTLDKYLTEIEVVGKFKKIVSREDTYLLKPDNEGFKFIRNEEMSLDQYLFVGDSEADKIAAEKSGISFVHVDDFDLTT